MAYECSQLSHLVEVQKVNAEDNNVDSIKQVIQVNCENLMLGVNPNLLVKAFRCTLKNTPMHG